MTRRSGSMPSLSPDDIELCDVIGWAESLEVELIDTPSAGVPLDKAILNAERDAAKALVDVLGPDLWLDESVRSGWDYWQIS